MGLSLVGEKSGYALTTQRCTDRGVLARVVRILGRRGWATLETLRADLEQWGGEEATRFLPDLNHYWLAFVEWQPGAWTLTPWVRLGVPFTPTLTTLPGHTFYERAAAEFWIKRAHVPGPDEEWHPSVRQVVNHQLTPVPDCFETDIHGEFQQLASLGVRRLRLNVDRMPEDLYFTRLSPQGDETYSVTGRAFLVDGPYGVRVVTEWASQRWREALSHPDGQPGLIWHPVGLRLKKAIQAARITRRPELEKFRF